MDTKTKENKRTFNYNATPHILTFFIAYLIAATILSGFIWSYTDTSLIAALFFITLCFFIFRKLINDIKVGKRFNHCQLEFDSYPPKQGKVFTARFVFPDKSGYQHKKIFTTLKCIKIKEYIEVTKEELEWERSESFQVEYASTPLIYESVISFKIPPELPPSGQATSSKKFDSTYKWNLTVTTMDPEPITLPFDFLVIL